VYADFESLLKSSSPPPHLSNIVQTHVPLAAAYLFVPAIEHEKAFPVKYEHFVGEDCIVKFLNALESLSFKVQSWYNAHAHKEMRITQTLQRNHDLCQK
jgi:hypothetical protein